MKTLKSPFMTAKIMILLVLLLLIKLDFVQAQIAQTGEFNIKQSFLSPVTFQDCPAFTCQIKNITAFVNTATLTDDLNRWKKLGADSVRFQLSKDSFIIRLNNQIDSIENIVIQTKVLELRIKNSQIKSLEIQLKNLFKLRNRFSSELENALKAQMEIQKLEFQDNQINHLATLFINNFNERQKRLKDLTKDLIGLENEFNAVESGTKNTGVSAMPQIFDLIEQVKPAFTLLGSAQINNKGVHSLGVYVGNGQGDTLSINSIIIPEFSKYGFYGIGYFSLNPALQNKYQGKFWLHYAIHAHEKSTYDLVNDTQLNFFRLQARFGLEYFIFKDILSTYYNFNWIKPFTNVESYRSNFNLPGYNQIFSDLGVRIFLKTNQSPIGGLGLFTDLNFIFLNDSFDRFNNAKDFVKPMIKLGLQANFR